MTIDELKDKRFCIILEALLKGIQIEYKQEWSIYYKEGQLYQTYYNSTLDTQITHKSEITLQAFLNRYNSVNNNQLKDVYGSLKLYDLQKKLTETGDEGNSGNVD